MSEGSRYAEVAQDRARSRGALIAERLRALADEVERVQVHTNLNDVKPDYGRYAADIQHKVVWGLANLHLDTLVRDAADADRAVRAEEPTE